MSLPTPPGTSHRDKENRVPRSASNSRVAWAQLNKYHNLASPPRKRLRASASAELPARSILKRSSGPVTAIPVEPERETTPEPSDPLADLRYLEWPVSQIMTPDASLRSLIEAYSVLAARLRSSVQENTDADCSWPLFQPLRKHRQVLVDAMCRDLGRALVDPLAGAAAEDTGPENPVEPEARTALPSPQKSPRKKRGMSAEQVKYARDLCTTTHSVIKLLAFVFTTPAVHHVFNDRDLSLLLTEVLAIPLARSLPTPNARKTCALAIWLIQTQRLPVSVLLPAKDRIAFALRRAIDGELGKEGKKGSASDGLRAIHELSLYEPAVFVPAFAGLLPSVLDNLLAVTLSLRTQACHALSGFALASTRIPQTLVHSHIAECVAAFLTEVPEQQSPRKKASPGQALVSVDPVIVRTLRTTLNAHDPPAVAHGPVWALSVMADFIVLLGSALTVSRKLSCMLSHLLSLAMRHKKSSVRGLACLLWRCISWTYFRPPLRSPQSEDDGEPDMGVEEDTVLTPEEEKLREEYWTVVKSVVDMGAGVGTVGAVLANRVDDEQDIKKVMGVVRTMAQKGTYVSEEAMSILARFVSLDEAPEWDWTKLLPESLFCSYPGLLTADFMALPVVVRPIIDATPSVADVRPLTKAELAGDGVIEGLLEVWKEGLHHLSLDSDAALPEEFIASWKGLLTVNVEILQDAENEDALITFAEQVATILGGILGDSKVIFVPPSRRRGADVSLGISSPVKRQGRSNAAMKLNVTRELWDVARKIIPEDDLAAAAEIVLTYLMENEHDLVWETDSTHDARNQWVLLCTEILVRCRETTTKIFWGAKHPSSAMKWKWDWSVEVRSYIWRTFVARWKEAAPSKWEGVLSLLGVPFADRDGWEMNTEDLETWEATLQFAINQSLDEGVETLRIIDHVAGIISSTHIPTSTSSTRVADLLVSSMEISEATDIPGTLLEFVNDTLVSTYPPEPRNLNASRWLLRNLTQLVDKCPTEMLRCVLEILQDGLATWISDEYQVFNQDDYDVDVVPLYENVAVCSRSIISVDTIVALVPVFRAGFTGRSDKPPSIANAFNDFWHTAVAQVSPPAEGWPEDLLVCLPAEQVVPVAFASNTEAAILSDVQSSPFDADQEDTLDGILRPAFDFDSSLPASAKAIEEAEVPPSLLPAEASLVDVQMLSTPKKKMSSPSSSSPPHRPSKSGDSAKFGPVLFSPQSPLAPAVSRRIRSPATPKRPTRSPRSPDKMDTSPDKENASPRRPLVSVMDRIAMQSSPIISVLGKRSQAEPASDERPTKRERLVASPIQPVPSSSSRDIASHAPLASQKNTDVGDVESETDCMQVEQTLFAFPASARLSPPPDMTAKATMGPLRRSVSPCPSPRPSARKRKLGVFLDAIEVPLLKDVRRQERRQNSASKASSSSRRPLTRSIRKTQSMNFPLQSGLLPPTRKRSQSRSQVRSSSPLRGLEDSQVIGSDDSISLAHTPTVRKPALPSSDDDPHQGQVTPHHLISPTMHRTMDLNGDPPSDDSNVSVSPSIQRVARRMSRSSSASFASSPLRLPIRLAVASPSA